MLAQPAMAVSPTLMNEALRQRMQREQQAHLADELREEIQKLANALQRQDQVRSSCESAVKPPASIQETHTMTPEEREQLRITLRALNTQILELQEAVQGIERQLNDSMQ